MLEYPEILEIWRTLTTSFANAVMLELKQEQMTIAGRTFRFKQFVKGERPAQGYTLIFGLHGGGGCPFQVNEQQFNNHMHLYDTYLPTGVIWFVVRSAEEASDMWWKYYMEDFFFRVIRGMVVSGVVNPDKVFLTGYSAGGDGIYHMGPRMADTISGAAMMVGHPNHAPMENCRNIIFSIQVGGLDDAYTRNKLAYQYIDKLRELGRKYGGYSQHLSRVHVEKGHWMQKSDALIFPQFLSYTRNPYPDKIVFVQHPRCQKPTFYYLKVDPTEHTHPIVVTKQGNTFHIEHYDHPITIQVNRKMINFKQKVRIIHNGVLTVEALPTITPKMVHLSIQQRVDPRYIFQDEFISIPEVRPVHQNSKHSNQQQISNKNLKQQPEHQQWPQQREQQWPQQWPHINKTVSLESQPVSKLMNPQLQSTQLANKQDAKLQDEQNHQSQREQNFPQPQQSYALQKNGKLTNPDSIKASEQHDRPASCGDVCSLI